MFAISWPARERHVDEPVPAKGTDFSYWQTFNPSRTRGLLETGPGSPTRLGMKISYFTSSNRDRAAGRIRTAAVTVKPKSSPFSPFFLE
jgi:hypothetical protein